MTSSIDALDVLVSNSSVFNTFRDSLAALPSGLDNRAFSFASSSAFSRLIIFFSDILSPRSETFLGISSIVLGMLGGGVSLIFNILERLLSLVGGIKGRILGGASKGAGGASILISRGLD